MFRALAALVFATVLTACGDASSHRTKEFMVPDLPSIQANLAFVCAYEKDHIPPRDPEADQLYRFARWLRKENILKKDETIYPKIERLIRISTAYNHDLANLELRNLLAHGEAKSLAPSQEALDLVEQLIKRGIPGGYYDMGRYLEEGYGVRRDSELALKYFRKAADLGSPAGQYLVGSKLLPIDVAPEIGKSMLLCAAEQGHGEAGLDLGVDLKTDQHYERALKAFQLSVKAGNATAASFLEEGFKGGAPDDVINYIGVNADAERARRYQAIGKILFGYDYLNPVVSELDEVVPLPPAKLPPWDGKLKWLKEHEARVPPPLPSEERIAEMAKAKRLDPATGRPTP